jgi:aminoglycoside 6'-N-acetyltransferase I
LASRYGLEIRAATAADAAGLSELLRAAGQTVRPAILAERLDNLRQAPGAALVAMEWGPPSGLVLLHWYRSLDASAPTAQITTLLVGPEERRRGIGRLLIKAASQAARTAGCGDLQIQVGSDQPDLQAFADATGFAGGGKILVRPLRKKG